MYYLLALLLAIEPKINKYLTVQSRILGIYILYFKKKILSGPLSQWTINYLLTILTTLSDELIRSLLKL